MLGAYNYSTALVHDLIIANSALHVRVIDYLFKGTQSAGAHAH